MSLVETHPHIAREAGPLLPLLLDPQIREIRCTSAGHVFTIHSEQGKQRQPDYDPHLLDGFLMLIADEVGGAWTPREPRLHAADPKLGIRIQAGRPPISDGAWMVCRKHNLRIYPLDDFEAKGILQRQARHRTALRLEAQPSIRQTLELALRERYSIVLSGAVGSSKTSLLNALLHELRDTGERIVILEEDRELMCTAEDSEFIRTADDPCITMRDLGKDLLRMSPDWVVVGEVRDGIALDMLKAFQTGCPGLCTVHAPSARETLPRFEQLVQEVSLDPQRHLIGEAVDVILHLEQYGQLWHVTDFLAVDGWDGAKYVTRSLV